MSQKAAPSSPGLSTPSKTELEYRAEDDFRTLERSEEIRGDKARHGRALANGRKRMTAISRVVGKARAPKRATGRA